MGGYVRLHAVSALAAQYAVAGPDQQAAVPQAYHLQLSIGSLSGFARLMTKLGLLLMDGTTFCLAGFPR